jgi:hypothetical protein
VATVHGLTRLGPHHDPGSLELMLPGGLRVGIESMNDRGQVVQVEWPRCVLQSSGSRCA